MATRNYSNTASQASLSAAIASTDTSFTLTNFAGYPAAPFTAALARGTANEEIVLVTAVSSGTVTVTRGYDGTSAKAQGAGTTFQEVAVALDFRDANLHVNGTAGVHGATGSVVGTTDVQTLTNKTLTSPTLTNPTATGTSTIATASVTTLNVSGVSTLAGVTGTTGTFSALVKGAGLESTAAATLAQIAAPAGVASKNTLWAQSDGGLYLAQGATTGGRISVYWGTGSAYPSAGALAGDTFKHSTYGFSVYDGANWLPVRTAPAGLVGGPVIEGTLSRSPDGAASTSANVSTPLQMTLNAAKTKGTWTAFSTRGWTCTTPGSYLVTMVLPLDGASGYYASATLESAQAPNGSAQAFPTYANLSTNGYAGVGGSLTVDAPAGISLTLAVFQSIAGTIRGGTHFRVQWLGALS